MVFVLSFSKKSQDDKRSVDPEPERESCDSKQATIRSLTPQESDGSLHPAQTTNSGQTLNAATETEKETADEDTIRKGKSAEKNREREKRTEDASTAADNVSCMTKTEQNISEKDMDCAKDSSVQNHSANTRKRKSETERENACEENDLSEEEGEQEDSDTETKTDEDVEGNDAKNLKNSGSGTDGSEVSTRIFRGVSTSLPRVSCERQRNVRKLQHFSSSTPLSPLKISSNLVCVHDQVAEQTPSGSRKIGRRNKSTWPEPKGRTFRLRRRAGRPPR